MKFKAVDIATCLAAVEAVTITLSGTRKSFVRKNYFQASTDQPRPTKNTVMLMKLRRSRRTNHFQIYLRDFDPCSSPFSAVIWFLASFWLLEKDYQSSRRTGIVENTKVQVKAEPVSADHYLFYIQVRRRRAAWLPVVVRPQKIFSLMMLHSHDGLTEITERGD
ncbi:uncharacterized protein LACBIDRAFT_333452 [Laccaria bicolor S238N-H82]|uniref:Predicted protein n=1 Tax=Laccaria bicolor (strain S238N-H82 / ATCC MYA-4686) TaxID=486041 RepID=B0DVY8_LACBS|nr:uncharacterized protein LACBIDRAFT_333452 [Laccaria bicolor S238N-H82]EDR01219.1 predicted protein [Laccaria bicolor S238N-H82]|eukprot:XP_001888095.1 predicted protein [Laccaria bicolor S238N-H82]